MSAIVSTLYAISEKKEDSAKQATRKAEDVLREAHRRVEEMREREDELRRSGEDRKKQACEALLYRHCGLMDINRFRRVFEKFAEDVATAEAEHQRRARARARQRAQGRRNQDGLRGCGQAIPEIRLSEHHREGRRAAPR